MAQFSTRTPDGMSHKLLQKLNKLGYKVLPHPPYSPDLLSTTTFLGISTTFSRENASTISRRQKCFSRVDQIPKHGCLHYRNKQTYFLLPKMTVMGPNLINKDVFAPCCCSCCSVAQSCLTLGDPMNCSSPGFLFLHHLPDLAQTRVY